MVPGVYIECVELLCVNFNFFRAIGGRLVLKIQPIVLFEKQSHSARRPIQLSRKKKQVKIKLNFPKKVSLLGKKTH